MSAPIKILRRSVWAVYQGAVEVHGARSTQGMLETKASVQM